MPNIAPGVEFMAADRSPVRLFFGVAEEMNLPTFFSVMVATAAASSLALAGHLARGRVSMALYVAATLLLLMAFDDFTALHERLDGIGEALAPTGATGYLWVLPGLVPGFVVLLAFWRLGQDVRGPARRDLVLGIVLVLVAALGLESINGQLHQPGTNGVPLQLGTHLEEFTETVGLILLLRGGLAMLEVSRRWGPTLRVAGGALRPPREETGQLGM